MNIIEKIKEYIEKTRRVKQAVKIANIYIEEVKRIIDIWTRYK